MEAMYLAHSRPFLQKPSKSLPKLPRQVQPKRLGRTIAQERKANL